MRKEFRLKNQVSRKKYWLVNAILSLPLRLSKPFRKKNIWVFGCWEGKRYDDSSKYLYEYVLEKYKDIYPVWISRDESVVNELINDGKPALYSKSKEAIFTMLKAGVAFYTNGLDDFSNVCLLYGSLIIDLNHATCGVKKLNYGQNKQGIKLVLTNIKKKLFNWFYFDYSITSSEVSRNYWCKTFDVKKDKIVITGLPRNDILIGDSYKVIRPTNMSKDNINILYMPTYRPYDNNVIQDFINYVDNEEKLKIVGDKKIIIHIKPHAAESSEVKVDSENIRLIKYNELQPVQELLLFSDILITDYSSCCIDFAIMKKPVILYAPDYDLYNLEVGVSEEYDEIFKSNEICSTLTELVDKIIEVIHIKNYQCEITRKINLLFEDSSITETSFTENVYQFVINELEKGAKIIQ